MTRETVLYHVCDSPHPESSGDVLATHVDKFSLNGYRYEIDTCDACSAALYGQLMAWADLGTCVGEPTVFDRTAAPVNQTVIVAPPVQVAEAEPAIPERRTGPRKVLPRTAERWTFSQHALDQMVERQFTREEVLWACERPEIVTPEFDERGGETRKRGRCLAVVDPYTATVITVKISGETKESWRESLVSAGQQQKGA